MYTLADLKEMKSMAVNTTSNGEAYREISNEELEDALLGDVIERKASYLLDGNASPARTVTHSLFQILENDCDGMDDIVHVFISNVVQIRDNMQSAYSKDDKVNIATQETLAFGLCNTIRGLQKALGKNSYYRWLDACKFETAGADSSRMNVRSNYDGFQNVQYGVTQLTEVSDEIYDKLTAIYGIALDLLKNNKGLLEIASAFPYASTPIENTSPVKYQDYFDRVDYFKSLEQHKVNAQPDMRQALASLVSRN
jgi:uncharacterized protein YqfB (UPF0267 family)